MDLGVGTRIGAYRLERLLGRGGMGEVYLATDEQLDRRVALKFLPAQLDHDEALRKRFLTESRLAASLDHPHIVPIYEAAELEGRSFIAMRYVDGTDLGALIERDGPMAVWRAIDLLRGVADALDAAHDRGLIHRDVKPGNILVTSTARLGEHAYLADFGLVKQLGSGAGFTQAGQFLGSLGYVAPEQIEGRPIDGRADVYSFACVVYEVLAGRPPFANDHDVATLWAHLQAPRPRISELVPELASLDEVLMRGMAVQPDDRYASAGELIRSVADAVEPFAARDRSPVLTTKQADSSRTDPVVAVPRRVMSRRSAVTGAGVAFVAAMGLVAMGLATGLLSMGPRPSVSGIPPSASAAPPSTAAGQPPGSASAASPAGTAGEAQVTVIELLRPPDSGQEPSAELAPGRRYEMALARPRTRFTIPGPGWRADRDYVDGFNLAREEPDPVEGSSAYPDYFSFGVVQVVYDGPCDDSPTRVLPQTPSALLQFLEEHPTVEATDPRPVNFGPHSGLSTELTIAGTPPAGTCTVPDDLPEVAQQRWSKRTYLFLFGEDVFHISPGERIRIVAVDVEEQLAVLMYGTVEPDRWDTFVPEAERLLQSVEFLP